MTPSAGSVHHWVGGAPVLPEIQLHSIHFIKKNHRTTEAICFDPNRFVISWHLGNVEIYTQIAESCYTG